MIRRRLQDVDAGAANLMGTNDLDTDPADDGPWHHPSPSTTVIAIGLRRHDRQCR
jgi:hypothetical protein